MASLRELIERRAYELFLMRGGVHGYHMEDWLRAEREITGASVPAAISLNAAQAPEKPPVPRRVPAASRNKRHLRRPTP